MATIYMCAVRAPLLLFHYLLVAFYLLLHIVRVIVNAVLIGFHNVMLCLIGAVARPVVLLMPDRESGNVDVNRRVVVHEVVRIEEVPLYPRVDSIRLRLDSLPVPTAKIDVVSLRLPGDFQKPQRGA